MSTALLADRRLAKIVNDIRGLSGSTAAPQLEAIREALIEHHEEFSALDAFVSGLILDFDPYVKECDRAGDGWTRWSKVVSDVKADEAALASRDKNARAVGRCKARILAFKSWPLDCTGPWTDSANRNALTAMWFCMQTWKGFHEDFVPVANRLIIAKHKSFTLGGMHKGILGTVEFSQTDWTHLHKLAKYRVAESPDLVNVYGTDLGAFDTVDSSRDWIEDVHGEVMVANGRALNTFPGWKEFGLGLGEHGFLVRRHYADTPIGGGGFVAPANSSVLEDDVSSSSRSSRRQLSPRSETADSDPAPLFFRMASPQSQSDGREESGDTGPVQEESRTRKRLALSDQRGRKRPCPDGTSTAEPAEQDSHGVASWRPARGGATSPLPASRSPGSAQPDCQSPESRLRNIVDSNLKTHGQATLFLQSPSASRSPGTSPPWPSRIGRPSSHSSSPASPVSSPCPAGSRLESGPSQVNDASISATSFASDEQLPARPPWLSGASVILLAALVVPVCTSKAKIRKAASVSAVSAWVSPLQTGRLLENVWAQAYSDIGFDPGDSQDPVQKAWVQGEVAWARVFVSGRGIGKGSASSWETADVQVASINQITHPDFGRLTILKDVGGEGFPAACRRLAVCSGDAPISIETSEGLERVTAEEVPDRLRNGRAATVGLSGLFKKVPFHSELLETATLRATANAKDPAGTAHELSKHVSTNSLDSKGIFQGPRIHGLGASCRYIVGGDELIYFLPREAMVEEFGDFAARGKHWTPRHKPVAVLVRTGEMCIIPALFPYCTLSLTLRAVVHQPWWDWKCIGSTVVGWELLLTNPMCATSPPTALPGLVDALHEVARIQAPGGLSEKELASFQRIRASPCRCETQCDPCSCLRSHKCQVWCAVANTENCRWSDLIEDDPVTDSFVGSLVDQPIVE